MRSFGNYLLQRNNRAAFVALLCSLLPFLGLPVAWFAAVIVALVTLRHGPKSGAYVLMWAALPAVALAFKGYWLLALSVVGLNVGLVWLLAVILHQTKSWALVLQLAALLGIIAVFVVHGVVPDVHTWWIGKLSSFLHQLTASSSITFDAGKMHAAIIWMAKLATGVQISLVLLGALLYLFIARWWQALLFNPGGLRKEWLALRMSKFASTILLVCALCIVFGINAAWDLLPVLFLPFLVSGLSLLHLLTQRVNNGLFLLIGCYVLLVVLFPYVATILVLAAWVDSWYDFCARGRPAE